MTVASRNLKHGSSLLLKPSLVQVDIQLVPVQFLSHKQSMLYPSADFKTLISNPLQLATVWGERRVNLFLTDSRIVAVFFSSQKIASNNRQRETHPACMSERTGHHKDIRGTSASAASSPCSLEAFCPRTVT